ncbi:MAG: PEP/pyruvate-binding domain-containing protein [Myxococcaceae bacterium]
MISLDQATTEACGAKAGGLARMLGAGVSVPAGFVLAPDELPSREALDAEWAKLGRAAVAVRSSGLGEDGALHSFAGQHDTVLGVTTLDGLVDAVAQCRASADSERAKAYRSHVGAAPLRMAVIVQVMIEPRLAGVIFSRSPTGDPDELLIEAVEGRGEALVSGRADPKRARLHRTTRQASLLEGPLDVPLLTRLADGALELERRFGEPLDLEWALGPDGTLWWLQARPITTSDFSADRPGLVWSNTNAGELLPDVATPMTFEVVNAVVKHLFSSFTEDLGIDWERTPLIGLVGGRVYFSMNTFSAAARTIGMGSRNPAELFGGHAAEIVAGLEKVGAAKQSFVRVSGFRLAKGVWRIVRRMLRHSKAEAPEEVAAVLAQSRELAAFELSKASEAELFAHLHRLNGGMGAGFHGVFAAISVGMACMNGVMQLSKKWLGDADGSLASALLAGLGDVESAQAGLELWRLGERLRAAGVLGDEAPSWPDFDARLTAQPELRAAWDAWMDKHGHHARAELDVSQPRWREVPEKVLTMLQAKSPRSPAQVEAEAIARRERAEAEVARRLTLRRGVFRAILERARRGVRLREQLKSESIRRIGLFRATVLELGRRLVARGVLAEVDDVFFLSLEALDAAVHGKADVRQRVARARASHRLWLPLTPPPVVVGRLDPSSALPPPVPGAPVLAGLAVSAGVYEGIARVILRDDDQTRVAPGEILVAPYTDPGWAPYFVAAGALVVDLGGVLSHGSIIAREYGIPAVVNVGHGTRRIKSGSRVRVDGFRGEVTILSEP